MRAGFLLCAVVLLAGTIGTAIGSEGLTALQVIDQQIGNGAVARDGSKVTVNYTGWLYDENAPDHHGAKVDSSLDRGQPISFTLGQGKVIAGWDTGVQGMKVGGRRRLVIPPHLGYGDRGAGGAIAPGETLIFVVDLLGVR